MLSDPRLEIQVSLPEFELADDDLMWQLQGPGPAAEYLRSLDAVQPGNRVLLACRVSGRAQRSHLIGMAAYMWELLEPKGAALVGLHAAVASGKDPGWIGPGLAKAERDADFIVVESPNRAVRHPWYDPRVPLFQQARATDLNELRHLACGFPIVSVVRPDATAGEERGHETARAARHTNHPRELRPIVLALSRAGFSCRQIERELNVLTNPLRAFGPDRPAPPPRNYSTISRWVKDAGL